MPSVNEIKWQKLCGNAGSANPYKARILSARPNLLKLLQTRDLMTRSMMVDIALTGTDWT